MIGGWSADELVARPAARRCSSMTIISSAARSPASGPPCRTDLPCIMPSRQTLTRHCCKLLARYVDGFDVASAGELQTLARPASTACRSASPVPASATRRSRARNRRGVTINLESEGEAERALAIAERVGRQPKTRGPGQSAVRHQGRRHEDGRPRQPVRGRCRPRRRAGPAGHRSRRRLARAAHFRGIAGACGGRA